MSVCLCRRRRMMMTTRTRRRDDNNYRTDDDDDNGTETGDTPADDELTGMCINSTVSNCQH